MTIQQFIEKAIEGGWKPSGFYGHTVEIKQDGENIITSPFGHAFATQADVLLDPEAWKAVGKVEGWNMKDENSFIMRPSPDIKECALGIFNRGTPVYYQAIMLQWLAEGKTIEQYLETL